MMMMMTMMVAASLTMMTGGGGRYYCDRSGAGGIDSLFVGWLLNVPATG